MMKSSVTERRTGTAGTSSAASGSASATRSRQLAEDGGDEIGQLLRRNRVVRNMGGDDFDRFLEKFDTASARFWGHL